MTTTDPTGATGVAAQLEAAFNTSPEAAQSALRTLYADAVDLRHVPALPSDGIVDGERLREASGREAAMVKRVIPDQHYDGVDVVADGARVHVKAWISGSLPTGKPVRLLADMSCTVRDGRIVGMEHRMDNDTLAGWLEVAAAAGMRPPEQLREEAGGE